MGQPENARRRAPCDYPPPLEVGRLIPEKLTDSLLTSFSLTWTVLDHLLDLLLYRLEVERSRVLHRRVFDCSLRQLSDVLLDLDEAPELPGKEVIAIPEGTRISRLAVQSN